MSDQRDLERQTFEDNINESENILLLDEAYSTRSNSLLGIEEATSDDE